MTAAVQQNLFEARAARDKALETVEINAETWFERALFVIYRMPQGTEATGEDVRLLVVEEIGQPHHHNTFGALISQAARKGYLRKTGEYRQMRAKKSHARETPVYVRAA